MHYVSLIFQITSYIILTFPFILYHVIYQVSAVHADKADKEAQKFKIGIAAAIN